MRIGGYLGSALHISTNGSPRTLAPGTWHKCGPCGAHRLLEKALGIMEGRGKATLAVRASPSLRAIGFNSY
eukprot:4308086-Heterocapsa_arctica.AAC.1